jgi:hypothetical protein
MKKQKTLLDIIVTDGIPNSLEQMVDNDFKHYKIHLLKKEADPDAIVLDGFDDALIGLTHDCRLVYDIDLMRKILIERDKMDSIEADEYLDYNVTNVKFGELNPCFVAIKMDLLLQTLK